MIHVLVTRSRDYTITAWLASSRAIGLRARLRPLHYESFDRPIDLAPGAYVFTDLERLAPAQLELALSVRESLAAHPDRYRILNDPTRVLRRYELLRALNEAGRNDFGVRRADGPLDGLRFPVFVRQERDHTGSLTDLLHGPGDLEAALRRLGNPLRSGLHRGDLLVVEFVDASAGDGRFVKYSAFRVGDRVLPRYRIASSHWVVKAESAPVDAADARAQADYVDTNPHAAWLRETFEIAGIDFGRIDYGEVNGRLQAWEINTNPTFGSRRRPGRDAHRERAAAHPEHERSRATFHAGFRAALEAIDPEVGTTSSTARRDEPVRFSAPDLLVARVRRERTMTALGRRYRGWLRKPAGHAARVAGVTLAAWAIGLGVRALTGTASAGLEALELVVMVPAVAALAYCGLRTAHERGRALALGAAAIGVPLVDVLGTAALTGVPAAGIEVSIVALRGAVIAGLLAVGLRGSEAGEVGERGGSMRDWMHRAGLAVAIGAPVAASMAAAVGVAPGREVWGVVWTIARGPLLLVAVAPLLSEIRPGRWSPAWPLGVAMGLLAFLAWRSTSGTAGAVVATVIAIAGNAALGGLLGVSADPLLRRRWFAGRQR